MTLLKKYAIMLKLLFSGYSEANSKDELYLLDALRKSKSIDDFNNICLVLGKSGGLFCIPTLMAFAKDTNLNKAATAIDTITQIKERVSDVASVEMEDFFSQSYWEIHWIASNERFLSYVACIAGIINENKLLEGDFLDRTAEKLVAEISINFFPYRSFRELRLATSGWEPEKDFVNILSEIHGDTLMGKILFDGTIVKSPEIMYDENIINMRCDYLLTRLNFNIDYQTLHYLLKVASKLNEPD